MTETDSENRPIGYARVSTYGQTLDTQITQLRAEGCVKLHRRTYNRIGEPVKSASVILDPTRAL